MSWYNNTNESSFQDATQIQLGGGGGGGSTSTTIIQNGDDITTGNTGFDTTVNDLISLRFDDPNFNVYVTNKNANGVIYFRTQDNNNKVKIENGKLYVWYDYNPGISLTITSGWTHIADYIVGNRQGQLNNAAGIAGLGVTVAAIELDILNQVKPSIFTAQTAITNHEGRIGYLEGRTSYAEVDNRYTSDAVQGAVVDSLENLGDSFADQLMNKTSWEGLKYILKNKYGVLVLVGLTATFGGYLSAGFAFAETIIDYFSEKDADEKISLLTNTLKTLENNPDNNTQDKLFKTGLTIVSSTNTGGLTDGVYNVETGNAELEITVSSGVASITDVLKNGEGFAVNDTIQINKSDIGGTTGTLDITVTTVYSYLEIVEIELNNQLQVKSLINNRNRRRQFIPDKNDFGDGLNITETNVTEPSGEITKSLDISLKLDTGQFSYDANGNLQLTNYNNLIYTNANGSVGINTTTPSASYKLDIVGDVNITSGDLYQNGSLLQLGSKWTTSGNNIYYSTGLVGIGASPTLSSTYKLQVDGGGFFKNDIVLQSSSTPSIWLYRDSSGSYLQQAFMYIENSGDYKYLFSIFDAPSVTPTTGYEFRINNARKFSIFNDGNVGIGTQYTSPSNKLDVEGSINISSGSKYKINGANLHYDDLDGSPNFLTTVTNNITDIEELLMPTNTTINTNPDYTIEIGYKGIEYTDYTSYFDVYIMPNYQPNKQVSNAQELVSVVTPTQSALSLVVYIVDGDDDYTSHLKGEMRYSLTSTLTQNTTGASALFSIKTNLVDLTTDMDKIIFQFLNYYVNYYKSGTTRKLIIKVPITRTLINVIITPNVNYIINNNYVTDTALYSFALYDSSGNPSSNSSTFTIPAYTNTLIRLALTDYAEWILTTPQQYLHTFNFSIYIDALGTSYYQTEYEVILYDIYNNSWSLGTSSHTMQPQTTHVFTFSNTNNNNPINKIQLKKYNPSSWVNNSEVVITDVDFIYDVRGNVTQYSTHDIDSILPTNPTKLNVYNAVDLNNDTLDVYLNGTLHEQVDISLTPTLVSAGWTKNVLTSMHVDFGDTNLIYHNCGFKINTLWSATDVENIEKLRIKTPKCFINDTTILEDVYVTNNLFVNDYSITVSTTGQISAVRRSANASDPVDSVTYIGLDENNALTGATQTVVQTALNVDPAGTDNSTDVTLTNVANNYLSISQQEITAGTVPVSLGGTGATTEAQARANLNVDIAGTDNSTDVTLTNVANNYLSISQQEITAGIVPVSLGGTGATTQAGARSALNVDVAGTDNSTDVTLTTVANNYLSISGQAITANTVPISLGGTGATTQAGARSALNVDVAGTDNSIPVTLTTVANNYLSISGQAITANTIPISLGGTGATNDVDARANLNIINNVRADWTETNSSAQSFIQNKPTLATVATTGSYNDLNNQLIFNSSQFTTSTDISTGTVTVTYAGGSSQWTTSGNDIYYNTGRVGIGTNASPTEYLTIYGSSGATIPSLGLQNGNAGLTFTNGCQIAFGYNGANWYQHFIHTRHNAISSYNAIDFYVCDGTQNNSVTSGSTHTMSLVSGNVGIGTTNPLYKLHVDGALYLTGSPSNPGNNASASFWNQSGVGPTIAGYNFAVNTNATVEAMRITEYGEVCLNASSGNPNHNDAKLYIVDGGSISSHGTSGASAMIEVRGGLGGGVPAGKNGLNVIHNNGSQGVGVGFAGIAQLGYSTNAPLYLWGRGASGQNYNIIMQDSSQTDRFRSYSNGDIWYGGSVLPSDIRIKKNVRDIDDKEALNKILLIEPKKYEYIDPEKSEDTVIGFIAQNIKEVIPEASRIGSNVIPNVLQNCKCDVDKIYINIPDIKVGHKINIRYDEINDEGVKTGIKLGVNLLVKEIHNDYILLENTPNNEGAKMIPEDITECFVYGYEVDDFINIRKDYLFTLNVSATQELHKIIMEQQNQIDMLKEILARNGIV